MYTRKLPSVSGKKINDRLVKYSLDMAYDLYLHGSITRMLSDLPGFSIRKMFGGVGYMIHGNMACGLAEDELFLRLFSEEFEMLRKQPGFHDTVLFGTAMRGWLSINIADIRSDDELREYLLHGVRFAESLPPK